MEKQRQIYIALWRYVEKDRKRERERDVESSKDTMIWM
jgi:hypothetical protein